MPETSTHPAPRAWVSQKLRTQSPTAILQWITAQQREAGQAMREAGVNPKTPEDRVKRASARKHRSWLRKLERALIEATKPRRRPSNLWRRSQPGAWGMEAQVYAANEGCRTLDRESAESPPPCPAKTPKAA